MFDECLLDCMQLSFAGCDAFDGFDLAILHLSDGHETTVNDLAVDNHRAGAAFAFAASFFCPGQMKLLAQNIEQAVHRIGQQRPRLTINSAIDFDFLCQNFLLDREQRVGRQMSQKPTVGSKEGQATFGFEC